MMYGGDDEHDREADPQVKAKGSRRTELDKAGQSRTKPDKNRRAGRSL
jgi:hypothetical protein